MLRRRQPGYDRSRDATLAPMDRVASRELRNNTRALLDRVHAGEVVTITVDGREVAELRPVASGRRWIPRAEFVERVLAAPADAALRGELRELVPDTTDDLPEV